MKLSSNFIFAASLSFLTGLPSVAQLELPALVSGDELESIKGSTVNRSTSVGGNSSLNVGSSTTFGASVNINSSPGTVSKSTSSLKLNAVGSQSGDSTDGETSSSSELCPTGGCLRSSIGGDDSSMTGSITNLRASDATIFNDNTIESNENTFSSGSVEFTGIKGVNTLVLDPNSQFNAETQSVSDDESTLEITKVSSAAASATIDTSTNTDIGSSTFKSSFQQAF